MASASASVSSQRTSHLQGPSITNGAVRVTEEAPQAVSFRESVRSHQLQQLGAYDQLLLSVKDEALIQKVVDFWELGPDGYFLDVLAIDILNDLKVLCPSDEKLQNEFLELYQMLSQAVERTEVEKTLRLKSSREGLEKAIEKGMQLYERLQIRMINSSVGKLTQSSGSKIKETHNKLGILLEFFNDPISSEFFTRYSIARFYQVLKPQNEDRHLNHYIDFLLKLDPNFTLTPEDLLLPVNQRYAKICHCNDKCFRRVKSLVASTVPDAVYLDSKGIDALSCANRINRRISGLKTFIETVYLKKDPLSTQIRARDNIHLFNSLKDGKKGHLHSKYQKVLDRVYAKLGSDFGDRLNRLLTKKNLESVIHSLPTLNDFPAVMRLLKKEIKTLHTQAMTEAGDLGEKVRESYLNCFQTLISLFIVLHDLNALRNANQHQLGNENIPRDLLHCVDLDFCPDSLEEEVAPSAGPSLPPPPSENKGPSLPPPPSESKGPSVRPLARSSQIQIAPRVKEAPALPSRGEKWHKAIYPILSRGFYLERHTDHQYYRHSRHPDVWIKISPHGTLSPGVVHAIKIAAAQVEELDKRFTD